MYSTERERQRGRGRETGENGERLAEGTSNNNYNKTTLSTPFVAQTLSMPKRVVCIASIVLCCVLLVGGTSVQPPDEDGVGVQVMSEIYVFCLAAICFAFLLLPLPRSLSHPL